MTVEDARDGLAHPRSYPENPHVLGWCPSVDAGRGHWKVPLCMWPRDKLIHRWGAAVDYIPSKVLARCECIECLVALDLLQQHGMKVVG